MPGLLHMERGNLKPQFTVSLNMEDEMFHRMKHAFKIHNKIATDASAKLAKC